jgi:hypothetical protein
MQSCQKKLICQYKHQQFSSSSSLPSPLLKHKRTNSLKVASGFIIIIIIVIWQFNRPRQNSSYSFSNKFFVNFFAAQTSPPNHMINFDHSPFVV